MTDLVDHPYQLEFYTDSYGHQPVRYWLLAELSAQERRTVGAALYQILQQQGVGVCGTAFGRQLDRGLFEFRLRDGSLLVRIFCHALGDRVILLLGAYDKGRDPSNRRQNQEITLARSRLTEWQTRRKR
jgi:Gp49-like protein DUF891